jgi:hypothetical protein
MVNAMELLQGWKAQDQMNALRQAAEQRQAAMHPMQMEAARMNMLAKRQAMQQEEMRRNALQQYGATGNINALAMGDPEMAAKLRMTQDRNMLRPGAAGTRAAGAGGGGMPKPQWDATRGVFVVPPTPENPQGTVIQPQGLPEVRTKEQQAAADALPGAIDKSERTLAQIDEMLGTEGLKLQPGQQKIEPHAGFRSAVGTAIPFIDGLAVPGLRYVPGTKTADFESRHKQITGKAFLQAFESLKGGGAITQIEGEKATEAINRMNLAQSEEEYVKAAREFQDEVRALIGIAKQRAGQKGRTGNISPSSDLSGGASVSGSGGWDDAKERRYQELLRKRNATQ